MEGKLCVLCHYARMREDICGIYCTGGFVEQDGTCRHFVPVEEEEQEGEEEIALRELQTTVKNHQKLPDECGKIKEEE